MRARQYTGCNSMVTTGAGGQTPAGPRETIFGGCEASPVAICEAPRKKMKVAFMVFTSGGCKYDVSKFAPGSVIHVLSFPQDSRYCQGT